LIKPLSATHVPLQVQTRNDFSCSGPAWRFCSCPGPRTKVERALGAGEAGERLACAVSRDRPKAGCCADRKFSGTGFVVSLKPVMPLLVRIRRRELCGGSRDGALSVQ